MSKTEYTIPLKELRDLDAKLINFRLREMWELISEGNKTIIDQNKYE
jgi:hypothetical protein